MLFHSSFKEVDLSSGHLRTDLSSGLKPSWVKIWSSNLRRIKTYTVLYDQISDRNIFFLFTESYDLQKKFNSFLCRPTKSSWYNLKNKWKFNLCLKLFVNQCIQQCSLQTLTLSLWRTITATSITNLRLQQKWNYGR